MKINKFVITTLRLWTNIALLLDTEVSYAVNLEKNRSWKQKVNGLTQ